MVSRLLISGLATSLLLASVSCHPKENADRTKVRDSLEDHLSLRIDATSLHLVSLEKALETIFEDPDINIATDNRLLEDPIRSFVEEAGRGTDIWHFDTVRDEWDHHRGKAGFVTFDGFKTGTIVVSERN